MAEARVLTRSSILSGKSSQLLLPSWIGSCRLPLSPGLISEGVTLRLGYVSPPMPDYLPTDEEDGDNF